MKGCGQSRCEISNETIYMYSKKSNTPGIFYLNYFTESRKVTYMLNMHFSNNFLTPL